MMGEIADWILEGGACQVCGVHLDDGEEPGYPRTCVGCSSKAGTFVLKRINCRYPNCRKKFQTDAAARQHLQNGGPTNFKM